jgi:hypothetical protein
MTICGMQACTAAKTAEKARARILQSTHTVTSTAQPGMYVSMTAWMLGGHEACVIQKMMMMITNGKVILEPRLRS